MNTLSMIWLMDNSVSADTQAPISSQELISRPETGSTLQAIYLKDPHPEKVNLLRGAYQAEVGTPFVPRSTILVGTLPYLPF
jgi:hypothetical protein